MARQPDPNHAVQVPALAGLRRDPPPMDADALAGIAEPYALINSPEGWYARVFDPAKDQLRSFRLDRIDGTLRYEEPLF